MGCDIHFHVEIKVDGEWQHYGHINVGRNYRLFGIMAGVRSHDVDPIVDPKGLPDDMNVVTKMDAEQWGRDGHTHSWLSSEEVFLLTEAIKEDGGITGRSDFECCDIWGYLFGNSYSGFIRYPEDRMPGVEDFRFVFWFDN